MLKKAGKSISTIVGALAFSASTILGAGNVSILGPWLKGTLHTKESGSQRALVVMLFGEGSADISAATVSYGGQAMTKVVEKAYSNGTYSYTGAFILGETGVAAAASGSIAVSWAKAPTTGSEIVSVFLSDANQSSLIGTAMAGFTVGTTISTSAPTNSSGDMILLAGTGASNGTYTINNGFTRGIAETSASFGDITSAFKPALGGFDIPSLTHSLAQRQTMVAFLVKAAAPAPNGESLPWLESFTANDGVTSDLSSTSWTAVRATGTMNTNQNRLRVSGGGTQGIFTSGIIDISSGAVEVSMDLVSQGSLESNQDYVKLFKKVNGGPEVLVGEKWGNQTATMISGSDIIGNTLQLVIRAYVSAAEENYFLDNIKVMKKAANAWIQTGNPLAKSAGSFSDLISANGINYVAFADPEYGNRLSVFMNIGSSWIPLGMRGMTDGPIIDAKLGQENGEIYVLYVQAAPSLGLTYVRKFDGTTWYVVGNSALTSIGNSADDIEIENGVVYASYSETIEPGADPCRYGNPRIISKLNGTAWEQIRNECSGKYGSVFQITMANGQLFSEFHTNYSPEINVIRQDAFNGTSWTNITTRDISESIQEGMEVVQDGAKLFAIYSLVGLNTVNCEMFDGLAWSYVGSRNFLAASTHHFAITASKGKPYFAFENQGKISVMAFNGINWNFVGLPDFTMGPWSEEYGYGNNGKLIINGNKPVILLSTRNSPSLSLMENSTNTPDWQVASAPLIKSAGTNAKVLVAGGKTYIAVADQAFGGRLTVFKQNGTNWEAVGNRGISNVAVSQNGVELGYDNGELFVAYLDGSADLKSGFVKKFTGSAWQNVGNATFTNLGSSLSDFEVAGGNVYVSYMEYTDHSDGNCPYGSPRAIVKLTGATWQPLINDCSGKYGSSYQISSSAGSLYAEASEFYYPYSMFTRLMAYNGSAWNTVTTKEIASSALGWKSLLDGNKLHLVYKVDGGNGYNYESYNGTAWSLSALPNSIQYPLTGLDLTLVDGAAYIAYAKNGSISVISNQNITWGLVGNSDFAKSEMNLGKNLTGTSPYLLLAPTAGQVINVMKFE